MSDQPVTPDREALITATTDALHEICGSYDQPADHLRQAYRVVDALLPLLTDALDRARQQGRDEAAAAIEGKANSEEHGLTAYWMHHCARLARGGPNREDGE